MGAEENKQIVRRQFELLNAGDTKGAAALWAKESFNHGRKVSPNQLEVAYEMLKALHERHILHEMVAEREWVAVRTTCDGVHAAKVMVNSEVFANVEPSRRKYSVQHVHMFRVVDGKLKEHWANRDDLGAVRQVGLEVRPAK